MQSLKWSLLAVITALSAITPLAMAFQPPGNQVDPNRDGAVQEPSTLPGSNPVAQAGGQSAGSPQSQPPVAADPSGEDRSQTDDVGGGALSPVSPGAPKVDGLVVVYPFTTGDTPNDLLRLQRQFGGNAHIHFDPAKSQLLVRASADIQAEIRGVIRFLTRPQTVVVPDGGTVLQGGVDPVPLSVFPVQQSQISQPPTMTFDAPPARRYYGVETPVAVSGPNNPDILRAQQQLSDATTDEAKRAARESLRQALARVFSDDMQQRSRQAAEIETRLTKLRQQYAEREKVKDKIIDLQLQVLEQNAAGLGFPNAQSGGPTPMSFDYGFRLTAPVPVKSVDAVQPEPPEVPLAEFKQQMAATYKELLDVGRVIESADGKIYAYAIVNRFAGLSVVHVVESATGKRLELTRFKGILGPLQFTNEGIAAHTTDGLLQLRIGLEQEVVPGSNPRLSNRTSQAGGKGGNPFYYYEGSGKWPQNRQGFETYGMLMPKESPLANFKQEHAATYKELTEKKRLIESTDGKVYAYAVVDEAANMSQIRAFDAATGKPLATATLEGIVGPLEFSDHGIASRAADGSLQLQMALPKRKVPTSTLKQPPENKETSAADIELMKATDRRIEEFTKASDAQTRLSSSLGIKVGKEMIQLVDPALAVTLVGADGEVSVKPGQSHAIALPQATTKLTWKSGDTELTLEDTEPFDFVVVVRSKQGEVKISCCRTAKLEAGSR